MPIYAFRCPRCGVFDVQQPLDADHHAAPCPACQQQAARRFTAPYLSAINPALDRAVTSAGLSSERPAVVTSVPPAAGAAPARASRDPRYPPLPRP